MSGNPGPGTTLRKISERRNRMSPLSTKSGRPGASAEDCALDARFRGHDEKTRITYADFGNEVLGAKPDNMIVGRESRSGVAAVTGAWARSAPAGGRNRPVPENALNVAGRNTAAARL